MKKKDLIQLKEFLDAKQSVYATSWIPTPWQILSWGLRQLGVIGDGTEGLDERVATADFVVMANVEVSFWVSAISMYIDDFLGCIQGCNG